MWLKSISLKDFRNYSEQDLEFHKGLNVFLGQNAQGKTNILEAIYFLSLTRSHRTHSDKDLIHFSSAELRVSGLIEKQTSHLPLEVQLSSRGRVTKVNHLKQTKLSNYIGHLNVVLFAPEDLQLIKGAPALRRKFLDMELGQIKPLYLSELASYNHVLKQRNTYLKQAETVDFDFLAVLDEQLLTFGTSVIKHRLDFIKKLENFSKKKHWDISQEKEQLSISYQSSVDFVDDETIYQAFNEALIKSRQRDLFKKNTGIGPHRDDVNFFINGVNANFGSQGQQRSLVLSLKLAEIELMKSVTRESPVLLLDDVMSELDNNRQLKLLETISKDVQTFITTTSLDHLKHLPDDLKLFEVDKGTIVEKKY
ncbi:DNA replication/repair protein RecF [Streptococcus ovuberis]|uniref:DNA replication and repair protein RecF n=1 Tax=Streptococcus ovuberis TaxID=1936207 RepID=A0A7X6MY98_9STRE|nr:DNA replication/repair protein RecF [Streptococcus ovuberis]NKZ20605.1 DNA replication/repair protein RecF [Streptococcus ovuberis]